MCIILDANLAGEFIKPKSADFSPVLKWLDKDGRIVYGKSLLAELGKTAELLRLLTRYYQAGKALFVDETIGIAEAAKGPDKHIVSNDQHIIWTALCSNARVLITNDGPLITDFTNSNVLKPKGKIYKNKSHKHLLCHSKKCRP